MLTSPIAVVYLRRGSVINIDIIKNIITFFRLYLHTNTPHVTVIYFRKWKDESGNECSGVFNNAVDLAIMRATACSAAVQRCFLQSATRCVLKPLVQCSLIYVAKFDNQNQVQCSMQLDRVMQQQVPRSA